MRQIVTALRTRKLAHSSVTKGDNPLLIPNIFELNDTLTDKGDSWGLQLTAACS